MHIIQEKIGVPTISMISGTENNGIFSVSPLPSGYGMTLGNGLRRVLLSSLPGTAVVGVKIEGVSHEYCTMDGVKDSVLDIILNLKGICFQKYNKERTTLKIEKKGPGAVTAGDIEASSDLKVLNPDHVITHLSDKNSKISMEIMVEKGVGYVSSESRKEREDLAEYIFIDAAFSPVRKVKYDVIPARVGDMTSLDNLEIEIETTGAMNAHDSLKFAASLLTSYFDLFTKEGEEVEPDFVADYSRCGMIEEKEEEKETYTPIEILNLSPRTLNSLINADIGSIEQLVRCSQAKLGTLRGFGKKAMTEVLDALGKRSMKLLGD